MDPFDLMCRHHPLPVVKSSKTSNDLDFDESLIDRILGTPDKIEIPERYIPEEEPELPPEEEQKRSQKAEAICRLLSKSNGGNVPLFLPHPKKYQPTPFIGGSPLTKNGGPLHHQHNPLGGQGLKGQQVLQHSASIPSSPVRRVVSVKKNATPTAAALRRRPPSTSSSLCDWSLAGVIPPAQ